MKVFGMDFRIVFWIGIGVRYGFQNLVFEV